MAKRDFNFRVLGSTIREKRIEFGIPARTLARIVGITPARYEQIESGEKEPSLNCLLSICCALRVEMSEIIAPCLAEHRERTSRAAAQSVPEEQQE